MTKKKETVKKEPKNQYYLIERTAINDVWIIQEQGYDCLGDLEEELQCENAMSMVVDKERFMVLYGSLYELKDVGFTCEYVDFQPIDDEE